jgi:hypothetical protein
MEGTTEGLASLSIAHHPPFNLPSASTLAAEAPGSKDSMLSALGRPPSFHDAVAVERFLHALPAFRDGCTPQSMLALFTPACAGCLALYTIQAAEILPASDVHGVLCALLSDPRGEIVTQADFHTIRAMLTSSCPLYRTSLPTAAKCTMLPGLAQLFLLRLGALMSSTEFAAAMRADQQATTHFAQSYLAQITAADEVSAAPLIASKWGVSSDVARAALDILERTRWPGHGMHA